MQELTDLVLRCQSTPTPETMNQLFQAVHPSIILGLQGYCGKDPLIEDFAQQAMMKAIQHFSASRAKTYAEFRSWCIAIATRVVADHYRKTSTRNLSVLNPEEIDRLREAGAQNDNPRFDLSIDATRALEILKTLGSPCREFLTLHYIQGLNYEEIGGLMEKSYDAVRIAISRCLGEARDSFDKSTYYAG